LGFPYELCRTLHDGRRPRVDVTAWTEDRPQADLLILLAREQQKGYPLTAFRALLILLWVILAGYTAIVIANHGMGLLSIFFGDMAAMGWPGQFNLDFMFLLLLSALWVAWRHQFSSAGLLLGAVAVFGGSLFLTAYLLVVIGQAKGDMKEVLLGKERAAVVGPG
jgi:hypothetical protein